MKATLEKIKSVITEEAERLRQSAAYGGEMGDGGASSLNKELEFFILGVKACVDSLIDENQISGLSTYLLEGDTEFLIPEKWNKLFIKEDPEYQKYLELKRKFER